LVLFRFLMPVFESSTKSYSDPPGQSVHVWAAFFQVCTISVVKVSKLYRNIFKYLSWKSETNSKSTVTIDGSHRIHVWYIHLHLPNKLPKCRWIYQFHGSYGVGIQSSFQVRTCCLFSGRVPSKRPTATHIPTKPGNVFRKSPILGALIGMGCVKFLGRYLL